MSGLDLSQLKALVVQPSLAVLGAHFASPASVNLLTGTALAESGCIYVQQLGGGPAVSIWQMERATHDDIWGNFLEYQTGLARSLETVMGPGDRWGQMIPNMAYACCMARLKYFRSPLPLPAATDAVGLSDYHARVYNAGGKADPVANTPLFQRAISA